MAYQGKIVSYIILLVYNFRPHENDLYMHIQQNRYDPITVFDKEHNQSIKFTINGFIRKKILSFYNVKYMIGTIFY